MTKPVRVLLILTAVVCFGIALSYPVLYGREGSSNDAAMEELARMRADALEREPSTDIMAGGADGQEAESGRTTEDDGPDREPVGLSADDGQDGDAALPTGEDGEDLGSDRLSLEDLILDYVPGMTWRQTPIPEYEELAAPLFLSGRRAVEDRTRREQALPYPLKQRLTLDEERILPELKGIYALNHDLTGWLKIEDTFIDYPVVQSKDSDYYLSHDFYGKENRNGQIILDTKCDPYTPSYNLVISGHHMRTGDMFGNLPHYADPAYWESHKFAEFDSLMERKRYVVMAAFYSADYDEDEAGFRYNADIQYKLDALQWLEEIRENQIYDTGIEGAFGDEFITLTTCDRSRRQDGRFVLILRRIREEETFE